MTLDQAVKLFYLSREVECAEETISYYKENVEQFVKYVEESRDCSASEIDLKSIVKQDFQAFVLDLRSRCRPDGSKVKNTSVCTYSRAVKVFFNFCVEEEYLEENCTQKVKLPKTDRALQYPLYADEVKLIDSQFSESTETGLRNLCIIHLMLDAGLRSGEVIRLNVGDILFAKNMILVTKSKNHQERLIPLAKELKKYLTKYLVLYRGVDPNSDLTEYRNICMIKQIKTDDRITGNVIKLLCSRLKIKTGISRFHAHLCRHTFGTSYIMGGGNLEVLRVLMGHSDYGVTKTYVELAAQMSIVHADVYKLDAVFFQFAYV